MSSIFSTSDIKHTIRYGNMFLPYESMTTDIDRIASTSHCQIISGYNTISVVILIDIAPMLSVHADSGAITKLCSILMDNATKFAKENTDIHAQLKKDGHDIHLIISNISESELSEQDLHHLFDRFYRPDASRNSSTGGSGLGLAMAKEIVQAHKGTTKAEMHDHALTIHITFPT